MDSLNKNLIAQVQQFAKISNQINKQLAPLKNIPNIGISASYANQISRIQNSINQVTEAMKNLNLSYIETLRTNMNSITQFNSLNICPTIDTIAKKLANLPNEALNNLPKIDTSEIMLSIDEVESLIYEAELSDIPIDNNAKNKLNSLKDSITDVPLADLLSILGLVLTLILFIFDIYKFTNDPSSELMTKQLNSLTRQEKTLNSIDNKLDTIKEVSNTCTEISNKNQ